MAERTCLDCPKPIGAKSKRCRPCANAVVNRDPERRAKAKATLKRRFDDPLVRDARTKRVREVMAEKMKDPAFVERKREIGRQHGGMRNLVKAHTPEMRAKAGRAISATKLAHIPPSYRALYRELGKNLFTAEERTRLVMEQIEADRAAAEREVRAAQERMEARHRRDLEQRY